MPKKGTGAGSSKKAPIPSASNDDDGSYIIFGNGKPKKEKKAADDSSGSKTKSDGTQSVQETPKKPDTRQLIGGASWTGKLPVNMLSEHCQKQKWAKPEYTMSKTAQGFSSMVILKGTNPKTKDSMALPPFKLPPSFKDIAFYPTAVEARHFAATYALFRVCSMKNIHMMLPPLYRDFWKKQFQELKVEDVKAGRAWMYEADPFTAEVERDEARAKLEKQRIEKEKQRAKEAEQPVSITFSNSSGGGPSKNARTAWTKTPKVDMGKRMRANVEDIVRRNGVWNPHALNLTSDQRKSIVDSLGGLGFRQSHIQEAVEECGSREETLEWLLIHVPEDDLPRWCLPENYAAGVSMASGNLKREGSIQRLASAGYSAEICASVLDECNGNEVKAAEELQARLTRDQSSNDQTQQPNIPSLNINNTEESIWKEEMSTLEAIYGARFSNVSTDACSIVLQVSNAPFPFTLHVMKSSSYPATPPILWVSAQTLPAYIRLSIIRQAVGRMEKEMLGQPMIFNLVDWLESEVLGIVERPGRLGDVAAGSSGVPVRGKDSVSSDQRRPRGPSYEVNKMAGSRKSLDILAHWTARQNTPQQQAMLSKRQSLPAWQLRDAIVSAVSAHQVTIISGETGSGKSTQAVQFVLDDMIQRKLGEAANIVCTQPRRISVLGLAERVSEERCSPVGDEVGYAIRGESRQKPGATRITFVTTGVLLRRLQTSGGSTEDIVAALADVSHVVVDEVHERNLDIDFLLIILREVLSKRKDLKVILMSATLDAGVFEAYFKTSTTVGKLEIQGRTHPVQDIYIDDVLRMTGFNAGQGGHKADELDVDWDDDPSIANTIQNLGMRINYDLIASTVRAIDAELQSREGAILVFLPGTAEINRTIEAVGRLPFVHALPLHASLTPAEQRKVFPPAPREKRKVIAATNVAETSITIEDVVAVIDLGKVKETSFDPSSNMVKLEEVWASRAACKQRRGRAGRVQAGKCYKLYTRNAETKMAERPEPEIRRVPLEQFALTPPENLAIQGALELLGRMGALDGDELTALGRHLSLIPADLRCGKLMVYGATFGCLEACLTIAAILTVRSPFLSPQAKREESKAARAAFAPDQGDLMCDLRAYEQWAEMSVYNSFRDVRLWCDKNFLSNQTMRDISSNRTQYHSSLKDAGFLPANHGQTTVQNLNRQNANNALIRALVAGAFNPQLARIDFPDKKFAPSMSGAVELDPEARTIKFFNQENGRVFTHPSSTLFGAQGFIGGSVYLSYFNKMATSKVFVRELTPFNVYTALLFSGPITVDTLGRGLLVDGWLRLRGWARIGVLISRLRLMLDDVLARKIDNPGLDLANDEVVDVVRRLIEKDGLDQ
ncbi:hypothetical protein G7Y79_00072g097730 [Physcia stellaris]|nr:hypothetical protein G7Y79_00072g097730 [Physcia stellaris]